MSNNPKQPLIIAEQGSFAIGGSTLKHDGVFRTDHFLEPEGQIAYGDHAYAFYQVPVDARPYPLIFQHGGAQCKRTWETTPDGREGFQTLFLRKGYTTVLIDQPRMGEAGLALKADDGRNPYAKNPLYADKTMYMLCRCGIFDGDTPVPYEDSAMAGDAETYNQFQRSWTPYEGELDDDVSANAMAALLEKMGPSILVTHSMGGTIGWRTPFRTDKVKAIIAFEPGGSPFIFPEGEVPGPVPTLYDPVKAQAMGVPLESFLALTKLPMVLFYGDHISDGTTDEIGPDKWRSEFMMAKEFVSCVNRHGGMAEIVHLPDLGIKGNTHFLMADKNNEVIAGLMADWLSAKGLS